LSYALLDRLLARLDELETTPTARTVILTGVGDRAFSAGADIAEFFRGVAAGPGGCVPRCEITEAAPLAIASERAMFAKPEIALGMPPTFGGTGDCRAE
jgi:enoyl-CoA hydratase